MTILVQRTYQVAFADQPRFEASCAAGRWPHLLSHGVPMLGYGTWIFGGRLDEVTAHFAYHDFAHLEQVHGGDALALDIPSDLQPLVRSASARVIELSEPLGGVSVDLPPEDAPESGGALGRGSIISERSYDVATESQAEFLRLSYEHVWPWLVHHGGRLVGFGHDPFGRSEELVTLFAFPSLADWHRLSRPGADLQPPPEMTEAWQQRTRLIRRHWGRLLAIASDHAVAG